jgi:rRNA maturation RNase YbeY
VIKNLTVNCKNNSKVEKAFVHKIISELRKELLFSVSSLQINFISSFEIKEINKKFLKHNYSTDIITFNYSGSNIELDGEMFISEDNALNNSKKYNVPFVSEITRLIIHGILHLIGYDDNTIKTKRRMKKLENQLVLKYRSKFL